MLKINIIQMDEFESLSLLLPIIYSILRLFTAASMSRIKLHRKIGKVSIKPLDNCNSIYLQKILSTLKNHHRYIVRNVRSTVTNC